MDYESSGPDNHLDPLAEPLIHAAADKLKAHFDEADTVVSDDEVDAAVKDAAEELHDAPVQTFVPLIVENKARNRLQDLTSERQHDKED